LIDLQTF